MLAHQYPATRDSFAPLVRDLLAAGIATLAFDQRGHGASIHGAAGPHRRGRPGRARAGGVRDRRSWPARGESASARIENDLLRVVGWGASQNFIDPERLALVGASVGGPGVLLAAPALPGLRGVATVGAAGAPAFGPEAPARIRQAIEGCGLPCLLASSEADPFEGGANVTRWSQGLAHVTSRLVPGAAHAMAIFYDVRDELLSFLRKALGVA